MKFTTWSSHGRHRAAGPTWGTRFWLWNCFVTVLRPVQFLTSTELSRSQELLFSSPWRESLIFSLSYFFLNTVNVNTGSQATVRVPLVVPGLILMVQEWYFLVFLFLSASFNVYIYIYFTYIIQNYLIAF